MSQRKTHRTPPPPSLAWAYFLDIDGTLIDLAPTPGDIEVDAPLLDLVARLYRATGGALALLSGRSLSDVELRLGEIRPLISGQHGIERRKADGTVTRLAPPVDAGADGMLSDALSRHPGLLLENKGLTLALHYRQAPHLAAYARRLMVGLARPGLEVQYGKCVAELKPAGIGKGTALAQYLAEPPFIGRRPVFIGDDASDEHAFAETNRRDGVSIKVGGGESCARFRLPNVAAVRRYLARALAGAAGNAA